MEVGKKRLREIIYTCRYASVSHHQNDSCIKMGRDENHFNVSLIVRDKVDQSQALSTNHNFLKSIKESRSGIEPMPRSLLTAARPNRLTLQ